MCGCPLFQSAPPAWAATGATLADRIRHGVSIRAARVGGDGGDCTRRRWHYRFNPRRPRGRRRPALVPSMRVCAFQSAPPAWAATRCHSSTAVVGAVSIRAARVGGDLLRYPKNAPSRVSIRAARVGGDQPHPLRLPCGRSFNPRRPRGRRPPSSIRPTGKMWFQSAPPAWAATLGFKPKQIHFQDRTFARTSVFVVPLVRFFGC